MEVDKRMEGGDYVKGRPPEGYMISFNTSQKTFLMLHEIGEGLGVPSYHLCVRNQD